MNSIIDEGIHDVLRAKGFLWLATANDDVILFSIAGKTLALEPQANWLAASPGSMIEQDEDTEAYLREVWQEPFGDRRQEIVFIGMGMDRAALTARLDAALLNDAEFEAGVRAWRGLSDPLAELFRDRESEAESAAA